jgi:2,4-dienoyl-CoA reductase-like NADH-dependent reductase (Old Yellow Enzyme family)
MSSSSKFFKKYTLNNKVEVPSLLAAAPMTLFGSNPDGTINDEERNFYKQRATGIGLYIVGATCVSLEGLAFDNQTRAFDDKDLPSNKERVKIIKEQGALAINQIHHGGCKGLKRLSGVPVMAVSADVFNKELEKKGELKEDTKAVEIT